MVIPIIYWFFLIYTYSTADAKKKLKLYDFFFIVFSQAFSPFSSSSSSSSLLAMKESHWTTLKYSLRKPILLT